MLTCFIFGAFILCQFLPLIEQLLFFYIPVSHRIRFIYKKLNYLVRMETQFICLHLFIMILDCRCRLMSSRQSKLMNKWQNVEISHLYFEVINWRIKAMGFTQLIVIFNLKINAFCVLRFNVQNRKKNRINFFFHVISKAILRMFFAIFFDLQFNYDIHEFSLHISNRMTRNRYFFSRAQNPKINGISVGKGKRIKLIKYSHVSSIYE